MASISDKLDDVIRDFNELIERNGGTPEPYKGGLTIMEHVEHISRLIDLIPSGSSAEAAQSAADAAQSALEAAASAAVAREVEASIPQEYAALSASVEKIDSTVGALESTLLTTEEVNWQDNWRKGYYKSADGTYAGQSNFYICTKTAYSFGSEAVLVKAQIANESSWGICAYAYDGQGAYQGMIGKTAPEHATPVISFVTQPGYTYHFATGRYGDGDSGDRAANAAFLATIRLFVTYAGDKRMRTGDFEWFSVTVDRPLAFGGEEQTTETQEVECVLRLPASYTQTGAPTRLVLACHGASGYIQRSTSTWYNSNWKTFMDALLAAGYAVFDANVLPTSAGTNNMGVSYGSPLYVNVLKKAYDYIQQHYNVTEKIFAHGTSQGGAGATAFSHAYPQLVLAESSFAGRNILHYLARMSTLSDVFATAYAYDSLSALDADKFSHIEGAFPSLSLVKYVDGVAQVPPDRETAYADWKAYYSEPASLSINDDAGIWFGKRQVPYKAWNSLEDNENDCMLQLVLKKAYNRGNACPYYAVTYETGTHTQMSYGQINDMIPQLIAWYKRWE